MFPRLFSVPTPRSPWSIVAGLILLLGAAPACTTPRGRAAAKSPDRAFITYSPPEEGATGLRLAVKDLIDMKGEVTTAGSEYLAKNSPPAKRDAKCLAIARERNVRIVGKTNVTEFAISVSGMNDYFGTPRNRLGRGRRLIPGGSSSGSAVAVANGYADVAFGTDTAGSIRVPAACCGILGLKTTFGLVPLDGIFPISPTNLDTVGPMAKDVARLVQGMDLLERGFAGRYRAAVAARPSAGGIRIGRLYVEGTDSKIDQAIDAALAAKGFQVVRLGRGFQSRWKQAEADARTVAAAGAWESHAKFQGLPGVSVRTRAAMAVGRFEYNTEYREALARKASWQRALRRVLSTVDFLAVPTMQRLPPAVPRFGGSPVFEAAVFTSQNTAPLNYAGNPAVAVPVPIDDRRVPLTSVQLVGPPRSEAALLNAARLLEPAPL